MAGVKVTISGFIAPLGKSAEDQPYPAVITGTASYTGLGVGGGPIPPSPGYPAHPIVIPQPPPEISGPPGPWPTPPIYLPPSPGEPDPPRPAHPIVLPPEVIPPPDGGGEQDKWLVQTYWTPETGWGVAIIPGPGHPGVPTPSKK
jgi:hypothetical protein